jgi:hypothetical protein
VQHSSEEQSENEPLKDGYFEDAAHLGETFLS